MDERWIERRVARASVVAAVLALVVATAAVETAPTRASAVSPRASCPRPGLSASIGGRRVCLKAGQRCSRNHEAAYRRYGFTCGARRRLVRVDTSQLVRSVYASLDADRAVSSRSTLLSATLDLAKPDSVVVESDGVIVPAGADVAAAAYVQVDGARITNLSTIDWRGSFDPVRHSYEAVGAAALAAGRHTIELVADPLSGSFTVSASANLSVLVHAARSVAASQLAAPAGPFAYTTLGMTGPDLPHATLASVTADASHATVALGAGSARSAAHDGDVMLGIYLDGRHPGPESSLWSVNDICACAETEGPLFTHALLAGGTATSVISLDATEFPWSLPPPANEDPAIFAIQPSATLVVLNGGLRVVGAGTSLLQFAPDEAGTVSDYGCIASSQAWPGCPAVGTDVMLSEEVVTVPDGHPGVVMFTAKTRVQGDPSDAGGTATLWITVDGNRQGSLGVQQLAAPSSVSQRTISASYLAAGNSRLSPGRHIVRVYGRAEGSFIHLVYLRDLPLLWFD